MPDWFLQTQRMTLRPLDPGDWTEFNRIMTISDAHIAPFTRTRPPDFSNEAFFRSQLALTAKGMVEGSCFPLVGIASDQSMVGFFNINSIMRGADQRGELGYLVSVDKTGRGLAKEGVKALVGHGLKATPEGLGLNRIQAAIKIGNIASERVAISAGLQFEGVMRGFLSVEGAFADHSLYAIIAGDP